MTETIPINNGATSGPAVNVIMPPYDTAAYITETLESVFVQTFADFEIIAVR